MYLQPQPRKETTNLNSFEIWWANLLPPQVKAIMPHWSISAALVTVLAVFSGNQLSITMVSLLPVQ